MTESLNGECFKVYGKAGDKVKAGDLVAEVDLQYIEGDVKAGESEVLVLTEKNVKAEEIDGWREADGRSKAAKQQRMKSGWITYSVIRRQMSALRTLSVTGRMHRSYRIITEL